MLASCHCQIPAMYEVISDELANVLLDVLLAIGKVHLSARWQPFGDCS